MSQDLTPKQNRILQFIQKFMEGHQVPPSFREIGEKFDISPGTVWDQIEALKKKGILGKDAFRARGLRLPTQAGQIPILGRVFAGSLHQAFENIEGHVPGELRKNGQGFFALKVRGDSMIGAGIYEGDIAIVRQQPLAENGDIVVAQIEEETTIKFFRQKGRALYLEAANPNYHPIHSPHIKIIGKVVEVRRRYE